MKLFHGINEVIANPPSPTCVAAVLVTTETEHESLFGDAADDAAIKAFYDYEDIKSDSSQTRSAAIAVIKAPKSALKSVSSYSPSDERSTSPPIQVARKQRRASIQCERQFQEPDVSQESIIHPPMIHFNNEVQVKVVDRAKDLCTESLWFSREDFVAIRRKVKDLVSKAEDAAYEAERAAREEERKKNSPTHTHRRLFYRRPKTKSSLSSLPSSVDVKKDSKRGIQDLSHTTSSRSSISSCSAESSAISPSNDTLSDVDRKKKGHYRRISGSDSLRGLEKYLPENKYSSRTARLRAWSVVLDPYNVHDNNHHNDAKREKEYDEEIAQLLQEQTAGSQAEALLRAVRDEEESNAYLVDTRQFYRRVSM